MKTKNARVSKKQSEDSLEWTLDQARSDIDCGYWSAMPEPYIRICLKADHEEHCVTWYIEHISRPGWLDGGYGRNVEEAKKYAYAAYMVLKGDKPSIIDADGFEFLADNTDRVDHPSHYQGKVECIDAIEAATENLSGVEAFCTGNAIKYLYRWKNKGGVEDLKKAKWYIDRIINAYPPEATSK